MTGVRFRVQYRNKSGRTSDTFTVAVSHRHAFNQVRDYIDSRGMGGPVLSTQQLEPQQASPPLAS